jgi:hypothetical protein
VSDHPRNMADGAREDPAAEGPRWYYADIVIEFTIGDDPRNVVHTNTCLVRAGSPEEAYLRAGEMGRSEEREYLNTDGKQVRVIFRGLRQLGVIYDDLEDGAEIFYAENVGVPEEELGRWAKPKEELSVFTPRQAKLSGPNCLPEEFACLLEAFPGLTAGGPPSEAPRGDLDPDREAAGRGDGDEDGIGDEM